MSCSFSYNYILLYVFQRTYFNLHIPQSISTMIAKISINLHPLFLRKIWFIFFCLKFLLIFAVPPDILDTESSSDVLAREGTDVSMVCKAKGYPTPTLTWRREDHQPVAVGNWQANNMKGNKSYAFIIFFSFAKLILWTITRGIDRWSRT